MAGGRQYEVVVLDAEPKALRGGRYLSTLVCVPCRAASLTSNTGEPSMVCYRTLGSEMNLRTTFLTVFLGVYDSISADAQSVQLYEDTLSKVREVLDAKHPFRLGLYKRVFGALHETKEMVGC